MRQHSSWYYANPKCFGCRSFLPSGFLPTTTANCDVDGDSDSDGDDDDCAGDCDDCCKSACLQWSDLSVCV